jgi:serine/threonine protein kinase/TolA-binding protein
LGQDPLGEVFVSIDRNTGNRVAVKQFDDWVCRDEEALDRYATTLARLKASPLDGSPLLIGYHLSNAEAYVVTELIEEFVTLGDYLAQHKQLAAKAAVGVVLGLLEVIQGLHEVGLVHGGITPSKILLTEGLEKTGIYLTDPGQFEIWKVDNPILTSRKHPGRFLGSAAFYSPEAAQGKAATVAGDIYTAGLILYTCISGEPPFTARTFSTTLKRQIYEQPLPLKTFRPNLEVPDGLEKVIAKALNKSEESRYESVETFMEALSQLGFSQESVAFSSTNEEEANLEPAEEEIEEAQVDAPAVEEEAVAESSIAEELEVVAAQQKRLKQMRKGMDARMKELDEEAFDDEAFDPEKPYGDKQTSVPAGQKTEMEVWFSARGDAIKDTSERDIPFVKDAYSVRFYLLLVLFIFSGVFGVSYFFTWMSDQQEIEIAVADFDDDEWDAIPFEGAVLTPVVSGEAEGEANAPSEEATFPLEAEQAVTPELNQLNVGPQDGVEGEAAPVLIGSTEIPAEQLEAVAPVEAVVPGNVANEVTVVEGNTTEASQEEVSVIEQNPPDDSVQEEEEEEEEVSDVVDVQASESELVRRGDQAFSRGDFAEAQLLFEQVIQINSRNDHAHYGLGNVYFEQGEFRRARRHHRWAEGYDSNNVDYLNALARDYYRLGSYEEAVSIWERAIEAGASSSEITQNLERARERLSEVGN